MVLLKQIKMGLSQIYMFRNSNNEKAKISSDVTFTCPFLLADKKKKKSYIPSSMYIVTKGEVIKKVSQKLHMLSKAASINSEDHSLLMVGVPIQSCHKLIVAFLKL